MQRVLVIDDEPRILEVVQKYLTREGYQVETARDGEAALMNFSAHNPDIIVLDLMLPKIDGLEVFRRMRARSSVPVIMLTAKGEETDRVVGLELGADDYMTKPFSPRELVARVKAVLRRATSGSMLYTGERPITRGDLRIDPRARSVEAQGKAVELTSKEFDLLWFLASHPGQVFTRTQLLDNIWGYEFYGDASTVTVHVRRVREKIETDPANPHYITTVWGVGYKFEKDK
jgi:two-component system response regulator ResD